jgi:prepilin-type N-terminal cleavage/methylation domain-containing protein
MKNNQKNGFTLIELLVVIAIIGILSAVVLASLNTARSKGNDAAVQSDLSTVQTQAEIYYGNNGNSYGDQAYITTGAVNCTGGMFSEGTIKNALAGADNANGASGTNTGKVGCYSTATSPSAYVVTASLASSTASLASYWCVDSTGFAGQLTAAAFPAGPLTKCQ